MQNFTRAMGFVALTALAACGGETTAPKPEQSINEESQSEKISMPLPEKCPIYESRNWEVALQPSGTRDVYRMTISGEVDLPSPAYKTSMKMGITDRALPPGVRIMLSAEPIEGAMAIQVITSQKIAFEEDVSFSQYRQVEVFCGDRLITRFENVSAGD